MASRPPFSAPLAADSVAVFYHAIPKLLVFISDKILLDSRFQEPCCSEHAETIAEFNRRLSGLLLAAYGFGLYDCLHEAFPECIALLAGRGVPVDRVPMLLQTWIIGIECLIRRSVAEQLVPALHRLTSCSAGLSQQALAPDPPLEGHAGAFYDLLAARNRKFAAEYILSRIREGTSIEDVYGRVLLPARERIKRLWCKNRLSAADVQTAEDICRYVMFRVIDSVFGERRYPFKAMVACVQGEEDPLSAEVLANFLEIKGWSVLFLGHDASDEDVLHAVSVNTPNVVVLSVASVSRLYEGRALLMRLKSEFPGMQVVGYGSAIMRARDAFEPLTNALITGFEQGHAAMLQLVIAHA
ncbi:MAG: cobalamin B12-binding domain-containing protein [Desulfobacterota bacterium]|nr:cobalamin B12-binding domain-containing protein [Thermodesulfobacteriota bacterium]